MNDKTTKAEVNETDARIEEGRAKLEKQGEKAAAAEEARREELSKPAELSPATDMEASGAMIEPEAVEAVEFDHPAVDNNPRAGTTVEQNAIDYNDPSLDSREAVKANLEAAK